MDERLRALIRTIDDSEILSVNRLKPERADLVVACASGRKYLLRFEEQHVSLLRQKWGYEQLMAGGNPCPKVAGFLEPDDDYPVAVCCSRGWMRCPPMT